MDHRPSSQCFARTIRSVMRVPSWHRPAVRIAFGLTLMIALGLGWFASAQDIVEPQAATMAPMAARALALDVVAVDGVYVAVGERGHILRSSDGGNTWKQVPSPTRSMLTGVSFIDSSHGWAVGHDTAILRTTDGGESWELVHWTPENEEPLFDVIFFDAEHGFAIGAYGSFFVTSDGGESWTFEAIGENDFHLHNIVAASSGRLYMAAEAGVVYASDDRGTTWQELPSPYEGSFFGVLPLDGDSLLLFGLRGHLFRSDDAGQSWDELETGTVAMLTDGVVLEDGTIVIVGLGGTVLVSTDAGRTFHLNQQSDRSGISSVIQSADGSLLMTGQFGVKITTLGELTGSPD